MTKESNFDIGKVSIDGISVKNSSISNIKSVSVSNEGNEYEIEISLYPGINQEQNSLQLEFSCKADLKANERASLKFTISYIFKIENLSELLTVKVTI